MTEKETSHASSQQQQPQQQQSEESSSPASVAMPKQPRLSSAGVAEVITVTVAPFTGGPFLVRVAKTDSVEELKKAVAKKLKVLKDRICLLYRER